ncbi:MAG: STAS domain-containing protein [Terriglobales bacterium]
MRSTLRLLKSVFLPDVFSLEAAAIEGASVPVSSIPATDDNFSSLSASACVSCDAAVAVKQLPVSMIQGAARNFLREVEPLLKCDRPHLVFDLSEVKCLDSAGVDTLLRCLQGASKRNGDLKLAAVSPELAAVLEWTKAGRLFETFESTTDAVQSFHQQRHWVNLAATLGLNYAAACPSIG